MSQTETDQWRFAGFDFPTTTPVPDQLFDELLHRLSGAELKVLLYIVRRTFGFKKSSDEISLSQMVKGIRKKDGTVLDRGTGLGKASVARALNSLEKKRVILRHRRRSNQKGDQATTYRLNILSQSPVSQNETPPVSNRDTPVSQQRDTQQTARQQTARQQQQRAQKSDSSRDTNRREIAAVLVEKGISQPAAELLVRRYDRQRIENNLDWFDWKCRTAPEAIKTNPAGLLRRAIEQDYAAEGHHRGFKTRQQKAAAAAKQKERLRAQERLIEARDRKQAALVQEKEKARAKRLETLREQYQTSARENRIWSSLLRKMKEQVSAVAYKAYLAQSVLLAIGDGEAVLAVPNQFVKKQLESRFSSRIQELLAKQLKEESVVIRCLVLEEEE